MDLHMHRHAEGTRMDVPVHSYARGLDAHAVSSTEYGYRYSLYSYGLYSYGQHSYGLYGYGLYSYGQHSCGRHSYGRVSSTEYG